MKINDIDNGTVAGLVSSLPLVGLASGMLNNEQMISDTNTFISTWKTNASVALTTTVELPLQSTGTYNFWVDWGDGRKDYVTSYTQIYVRETVARTHTYRTPGTYTIKITGLIRGWSFVITANERPKLLSIERFGCLEVLDDTLNGVHFSGCTNLDLLNVKDTLSTKYLTYFLGFFQSCASLKVNLINNWDVSRATNMQAMFQSATTFNQPIGNWDTSKVTTMNNMFNGANAFNQTIDSWNISAVTNMQSMFSVTPNFNQPLSNWERSDSTMANVTTLSTMFNSSNFNQNIGNWNVSKVTSFINMFNNSTFNNGESADINNWNINTISSVTMLGTFQNNTVFNQPIGNWNTSQVTTMNTMFNGATAFNQPLSNWERVGSTLANVTSFGSMFSNATNFNQPIGNWNTSKVNTMNAMFTGASAFKQDIGSWDIGLVTNFTNFMSTKGRVSFPSIYLDAIYNGWSSRPSQSNLSISFGTAKYTVASMAGRATLISRGWTIVDGLVTVSGTSNNAGLIRLTTTAAHAFTTGELIYVYGVTGTTNANGTWSVFVVDATTIQLNASVFNAAWISGGNIILA